ncbi:hypothetical protein HLK66_20585 [Niallia circulans]|uniref:hypothetical protein n=1 Tax=Niallia circulans TaxID=1397 RepID=UPI00148FD88D|nr:hypothetical protein [Niallia circulans]QJX63800.1 hypothetical protein HLK66_20585 [Niallia circulans]
MIADFSEFTYGFALTHELINISSRIVPVAPVFPSLIEEGRIGGGYDVGIEFSGYPLFLQFKLSEYMKNSSSKEWSVYNAPYYRFAIRPSSKSNQHDLLLQLERSRRNVFYVAPAFNKVTEINNAFFTSSVASNSVFVRPSVIGSLPDNNEHNVIFQPNSNIGYFCSNPQKIEVTNSEKFTQVLLNELRKEDYLANKADFIELGRELLIIASELMGDKWKDLRENYLTGIPNNPEQVVSYFSRLLFNCAFYLVKDK